MIICLNANLQKNKEILLSGKTLKKQKQIARLLIISGRALFYTMTSPLSQKAMAVEVHR